MKTSGPAAVPAFWDNGLPIAVAHRGGDALGADKENSLAAVEAAIKLGYRWFETDVVPTSDGQLLAIHGRGYQLHPNRDLPRRHAIQQMTYAEMQAKIRIGGEPPVRLEELLSGFPDTKWFIDPKVSKAVAPLAALLSRPSMDLDRFVVGAFSQRRVNEVAAIVRQARGRDICVAAGPVAGFAVLSCSDVEVSKLELRDRLLFRWLKATGRLSDPAGLIKSTGASSVHVPYRWLRYSTNLVEVAHGLGLRVASWTPNEAGDMKMSIERGADAVMSDNIRGLKKIILETNPHNPSIRQ